MSKPSHTLSSLLEILLPTVNLTQPPPRPTDASLTAAISSLLLHPTVEATLHLLNADLPSAHFLVRHMQAPPAIEGMLLHSILHRCEGDLRNARLWASDVQDASDGWMPKKKGAQRLDFSVVQGMKGKATSGIRFVEFVYRNDKVEIERLIDDVGKFRQDGKKERDVELEERIRVELERVLMWCRQKFGDGEYMDASAALVRHSEEVRKKGEDMVSGGKGFREF